MKIIFISIISLTLLLWGCERANPAASQPDSKRPERTANAPRRSGNIIKFDINSPQLARIRAVPVEEAEVPIAELSAPGKVELNPGRVSRVTLPVPGRIREVQVG